MGSNWGGIKKVVKIAENIKKVLVRCFVVW